MTQPTGKNIEKVNHILTEAELREMGYSSCGCADDLRRLIQSHRALQGELSEARDAFRKLNLQALENHNRMTKERDDLRTELEESARLHGMGSEREAALMAKLDRVTKERDELKRRLDDASPEDFHAAKNTAMGKLKAELQVMDKALIDRNQECADLEEKLTIAVEALEEADRAFTRQACSLYGPEVGKDPMHGEHIVVRQALSRIRGDTT